MILYLHCYGVSSSWAYIVHAENVDNMPLMCRVVHESKRHSPDTLLNTSMNTAGNDPTFFLSLKKNVTLNMCKWLPTETYSVHILCSSGFYLFCVGTFLCKSPTLITTIRTKMCKISHFLFMLQFLIISL